MTPFTPEQIQALAERIDVVDCPRCHEQCGWCSDYRLIHGKLKLPGTRKKCTIPAMHPDDDCPLCHGSLKVQRTIFYRGAA